MTAKALPLKFFLKEANKATPLLQRLIKQNKKDGWKETNDVNDCRVFFAAPKFEDKDRIELLMKKTITNPLMVFRYPESGHLCRKDVFGDLMEFSRDLAPEEFDFIPPTYNLPMEVNKFHAYMKAHPGAIYIAKP